MTLGAECLPSQVGAEADRRRHLGRGNSERRWANSVAWSLQTYGRKLLPGMVEVWAACFRGGPNCVCATEDELIARVISQASFERSGLLVATTGAQVSGFVHFGARSNFWYYLRDRQADFREGQVYALVAPPGERDLMRLLLEAAVGRLREAGAKRVLLGPTWVQGTQPFYNGIAGGYEIPGLSATRKDLLEVAAEQGFAEETGYATPELDLRDETHVAALRSQGEPLMEVARDWGLRTVTVSLEPWFFAGRHAVALGNGGQTVATTAYGLWHEYAREHGRRMFGITSVHVSEGWRGRGLGKLIMILALEAAKQEGAEAVHLHVWEENQPAWNLYHRALGFRPKWRWVTLSKALG
jgi:GNAT superfamily N-acetyltransferase